MVIPGFSFSGVPDIVFGAGSFLGLPGRLLKYGPRVLLVTGGSSLEWSGKLEALMVLMKRMSLQVRHVTVKNEPSPELVDDAVASYGRENIDAVLAVGGGSVIDAGKAISAMLPSMEPVYDYLESSVPGKVHDGRKVPFIAVPTTSGTGSEATKNAVLSRVGPGGFKKSLRHDKFIPDLAVIDPELSLACPAGITASTGLDAFTQLLGAYVSTASSPLTDAIAFKGLELAGRCLIPVCTGDHENTELRGGMALAALFSGIVLANAGLDIVHGLASPIGGYFDIPHGIICGTLAGEAARVNIESLSAAGDTAALRKYARVGSLLSGLDEQDVPGCCEELVLIVNKWIDLLEIPRLGSYGIGVRDLDEIVDKTGLKNNPVSLTKEQIRSIVKNRL